MPSLKSLPSNKTVAKDYERDLQILSLSTIPMINCDADEVEDQTINLLSPIAHDPYIKIPESFKSNLLVKRLDTDGEGKKPLKKL